MNTIKFICPHCGNVLELGDTIYAQIGISGDFSIEGCSNCCEHPTYGEKMKVNDLLSNINFLIIN